jgi:hypothetical protein
MRRNDYIGGTLSCPLMLPHAQLASPTGNESTSAIQDHIKAQLHVLHSHPLLNNERNKEPCAVITLEEHGDAAAVVSCLCFSSLDLLERLTTTTYNSEPSSYATFNDKTIKIRPCRCTGLCM